MSVDAVVVDLDGTVYRGSTVVPGAPAAIDAIRASGRSVLFVSNNPTLTPASYARRLSSMGIDADPEEVLTSGVVTASYLRAEHADESVFVVGTDDLHELLDDAGVRLSDPARADVLVGSWTDEFDYETMATVLRHFEESGTFLGTDPDRTFPGDDGVSRPGSGAIVSAIAGVLGREPEAVLGKPRREAIDAVLDRLDVPPERCLVVGDRLDTDVAMGERAGMTTALVLSGVTDREDLDDADVTPDYVLDDLGDVERLL